MVELDEQLRSYSEWLAEEVDRRFVERSTAAVISIDQIEAGRTRGRPP